ncbi:MAG TPA: hypothetical protein VJ044_01030, partial [Candidatus Hodarchaeales archaeon]|nr:hypothetical protein [Candidatus Hodarchaeales archaeon]
ILELEGRRKKIYSQDLDNFFGFHFITAALQNPSDVLQGLVQIALEQQAKFDVSDQSEFVALTTPDGLPLWTLSKSSDPLLQYSIEEGFVSCFSSIERMQIELGIGPLKELHLSGIKSQSLRIQMNQAGDLALATYRRENEEFISIQSFFSTIQRNQGRLRIPEEFKELLGKTPPKSQIAEEMLRSTGQGEHDEPSEDEIISLTGFDFGTIDRIEKTIKAIAKSYNINEISVPYLRGLFQLPAAAIDMSLQFLIIEGRLGRSALARTSSSSLGNDRLILDLHEPSEEEKSFLMELDKVHSSLLADVASVSDLLSTFIQEASSRPSMLTEYSAIMENTDSYPLMVLIRDMHELNREIKDEMRKLDVRARQESSKTSRKEDDLIRSRINALAESFRQKLRSLRKDLLSMNFMLSRLIPDPTNVEYIDDTSSDYPVPVLAFACAEKTCEKTVAVPISTSIAAWKKYLLFRNDKLANATISEFNKDLEEKRQKIPAEPDTPFISSYSWELELFVPQNEERDQLLRDTYKHIDQLDRAEKHWMSTLELCFACDFWFCANHYNSEQFKCVFHQR